MSDAFSDAWNWISRQFSADDPTGRAASNPRPTASPDARSEPSSGLASRTAEQAGYWAGWWWKDPLQDSVRKFPEIIKPYFAAVLDQKLTDILQRAIWPSALVLILVLSAVAAAGSVGVAAARVLAGTALLMSMSWGLWASGHGIVQLLPYLKRWLAQPRWPRRFAEDEVLMLIETRLGKLRAESGAFFQGMLRGSGLEVRDIAETLAAEVVSDLGKRFALRILLLVAPILVALVYFRLAIQPALVRAGLGLELWQLVLLPLALVIDYVAGTSFAQALGAG